MAPEKGGLKFSVVVPQVGGVEALKISAVAVTLKYNRSNGDDTVKIFEGEIFVSLKEQKAGEAKLIQAGTITPGAIREVQVGIGSATATWAASGGTTRSANLLVSQGGQFTLGSVGNVPIPAGRNVNLEIQMGIHCPVVEPMGAIPALLVAGRSYFEKGAGDPSNPTVQPSDWVLSIKYTQDLPTLTLDPTDTSRKACEQILSPDSIAPTCKINSPVSGTSVPSEVTIQFQCVDPEPTYGLDQATLSLSLDGQPVESTQDWTVWVDKRDQSTSVPVAVSGKKDVSSGAGGHEISVVVKDRVGNASPAAKTSFTISPPSAAGPSISNVCSLIDVRATGPDSESPTMILIRADVSSSARQDVTLTAIGGGVWKMTAKPPAQYRVILPAKEVAGHTLQIAAQDAKGGKSDLLFEPGTSYLYRDVFPNWLLTHWDAAAEKFILEPPPESGEDTRLLFTEPCFDPTEVEPGFRFSDLPSVCGEPGIECLGSVYLY